VPAQDRIVAPATAAALADELPQVTRMVPALGHIGMIVAREAPRLVWQPLTAWLSRALARVGSKTRRGGLSR
jgi:hypothetical protein